MLAYKFRGSAPVEHILDVLYNRRLYCAEFHSLNDPMEGRFSECFRNSASEGGSRTEAVRGALSSLRVCSLSRGFHSRLLWSHYAAGWRGVAVEVEVPDEAVTEVTYDPDGPRLNLWEEGEPQTAARQLAATKFWEWQYECEVRVLGYDPWFALASPPRRLLLGKLIAEPLRLALMDVCASLGVPVATVTWGIDGAEVEEE